MLADDDSHNRYDSGALDDTFSLFDDKQLVSILKHGNNQSIKINELLRTLEDWRNRYNITVIKECDRSDYCSGEFRDVILGYNAIHGYVSLLICLFGSLANVFNVAVLTRRDLAAAPINRLLKWLAVADVFVMMEYVPFSIYRYMLLPRQEERPYAWAVYMLFHMHFTQLFHTASILLTLSLAIWRYIAIKYPSYGPSLCTDRRCSLAIFLSFLLPPILCIPSYFVFTIHEEVSFDKTASKIASKVYYVDSNYEGVLYQLNFWVHAVFIKLLPCVILTIISAWLIRVLYRANSRKKMLKGYNACPASSVVATNGNVFTRKLTKRSKAEKRTDRTTKMLVAVLLLFLLTEFPQGILGLMSGALGRCFFKRCYDLFGELMDALALLNGAINFILYCSMSRQFRTTFGQLIRNRCTATPRASSHTELQTTYV
ncbi:PREDICTED: sex peptide receptor-like [Papilio xuthus]|uniref:Sex peptide receptor-like n=1 Tax=Papilio xuthus TaxID=66420 RepID=A0AAJ6Z0A9_PAPXU|nr:PREDICTED: sex peptide receptor-like [Papilio xuthus]XP_013162607.1 PREDICTED: sex peptide receptor-like [Papilio xuthus]XP_013162608.1 PREDICTED: sex peptide receptor-like [Papilio xuthus]XP_013162609.1 PREDICTED: sex peptide receptor-like [Papilio xuthus]